mmetsp:Transcript_25406/g.70741  ORF Transcript_25406/g.70741 Transcript_25406/m.70741 type:complete len:462 (-) Transcript_25406:968-2353(-)
MWSKKRATGRSFVSTTCSPPYSAACRICVNSSFSNMQTVLNSFSDNEIDWVLAGFVTMTRTSTLSAGPFVVRSAWASVSLNSSAVSGSIKLHNSVACFSFGCNVLMMPSTRLLASSLKPPGIGAVASASGAPAALATSASLYSSTAISAVGGSTSSGSLPGMRSNSNSLPTASRSKAFNACVSPTFNILPLRYVGPFPAFTATTLSKPTITVQWSGTTDKDCGLKSPCGPKVISGLDRMNIKTPLRKLSMSKFVKCGSSEPPSSCTKAMPYFAYFSRRSASLSSFAPLLSFSCTFRISAIFSATAFSRSSSLKPPPPVEVPASCAFSCLSRSICNLIASNSCISLRSAADIAVVAFLGCTLMTDAFFAKPKVENVYLWNSTSGRMAQNKYVFACRSVSLRYLQRKKLLQPGMVAPGLNLFFITASAIFMKNCAISDSDRLIFLPWSCSSFVLFLSGCGPVH